MKKTKKAPSGRSVEEIQAALDVAEAEKKIVNLRKKVICDKIDALQVELKTNCVHPKDKVVQRDRYYGGSYDDRASTTYWNECTICGETSESWTKTHSYYG